MGNPHRQLPEPTLHRVRITAKHIALQTTFPISTSDMRFADLPVTNNQNLSGLLTLPPNPDNS